MQLLGFSASQVHPLATLDEAHDFLAGNAAARFVWADFLFDEVSPAPAAWRDRLAGLTGSPIHDLHLVDAINPTHPSFFDTTNAYDMMIFRKLTFETSRLFAEADAASGVAAGAAVSTPGASVEPAAGIAPVAGSPAAPAPVAAVPVAPASTSQKPARKYPAGFLPALARIDTQPVTFFVFDSVLVTVRPGPSRTVDQVRQRLLELCGAPRPASARANGQTPLVHGVRPPTRPRT